MSAQTSKMTKPRRDQKTLLCLLSAKKLSFHFCNTCIRHNSQLNQAGSMTGMRQRSVHPRQRSLQQAMRHGGKRFQERVNFFKKSKMHLQWRATKRKATASGHEATSPHRRRTQHFSVGQSSPTMRGWAGAVIQESQTNKCRLGGHPLLSGC